tara:strand:- start:464 stop:661 length:198 start_codon:yes stop_codon:yes gene_type:complete
MSFIVYKLNRMSLVPDKYGKHLKIKMLSKYNEEGEFVEHVKLDEKAIDILTNGYFMPAKPEYDEV